MSLSCCRPPPSSCARTLPPGPASASASSPSSSSPPQQPASPASSSSASLEQLLAAPLSWRQAQEVAARHGAALAGSGSGTGAALDALLADAVARHTALWAGAGVTTAGGGPAPAPVAGGGVAAGGGSGVGGGADAPPVPPPAVMVCFRESLVLDAASTLPSMTPGAAHGHRCARRAPLRWVVSLGRGTGRPAPWLIPQGASASRLQARCRSQGGGLPTCKSERMQMALPMRKCCYTRLSLGRSAARCTFALVSCCCCCCQAAVLWLQKRASQGWRAVRARPPPPTPLRPLIRPFLRLRVRRAAAAWRSRCTCPRWRPRRGWAPGGRPSCGACWPRPWRRRGRCRCLRTCSTGAHAAYRTHARARIHAHVQHAPSRPRP